MTNTVLVTLMVSGKALAEELEKNSADKASKMMEMVMVVGNADRVKDIAGSAHFIGAETLESIIIISIQVFRLNTEG